MFNLLPSNLKGFIKDEYKVRKLVVILFFIICVEASFLIFIFPTWLTSFYKEKVVVSQSEEINKLLSESNVAPATAVIKGLNSKLNVINNSLEYPTLLPFVDSVLEQKTASIKIDQFVYTLVDKTSAELTVGGVSVTRDALVAFVKKLEETKLFKKVNLPIGNLAKDKNIDFTLSLSIAK